MQWSCLIKAGSAERISEEAHTGEKRKVTEEKSHRGEKSHWRKEKSHRGEKSHAKNSAL